MLSRFTNIFIVFLVLFFFLVSPISAQQDNTAPPPAKDERLEATITKVIEEKEIELEGSEKKQLYQKLQTTITRGSKKSQTITIENGNLPTVNARSYQVGDTIVITASKDFQGKDLYYITDYVRRSSIYWLFFIFAGLTVVIGRKRGVLSLLGMALSFLIIFTFILPQISSGADPIVIAIIASIGIIPITFYLSHGINKKTHIAVVGTFIALVCTGLLANFFVDAARLTGFASEEAGFLEAMKQGSVNIQGLLLAGIIIGVLGVLDDITISQASIVQQLKKTDPSLSFHELYSRGMEIGRDHIASMVNTLVLVYTGAALPLLLLFINNPSPFSEVINYEILAEEIIRTLVASIGLILAVPITTLIAAWVLERENLLPTENKRKESGTQPKRRKFIIRS